MKWQKDTTSPIYFNNCATEMKFSVEAMKLSGVNQYEIVKGWFEKTLPNFRPSRPIAILRLDADWYDSTMQCLDNLYPFITKGGVIIIDDYYTWDGCRKAVYDFLSKNKLADKIFSSEHGVCYIVKN